MLISEAVTLENELDIVQRQIADLNHFIATANPSSEALAGAMDLLWRAIDKEADLHNRLYNQPESLSTPEPEPVIEQVKPKPEPVAVEDVQKEPDEPVTEADEPVPTYVVEQVQTDIKQYTEQLEVFDKAIQTTAFAELSEDEQARRMRARDHLAGYLEESKAELEGFGPLFDGLNELEPVEELEQEFERQNAPDLASDFDVLFNSEPEQETAQVVSTADELADLQAKVSQAKALAEKNQQLQSEKAVIESELSDLERQLEQIFSGGYNEFSDIEAAKIQREIEVRQRCKREILAHFESPESIVPAWAKWQDRIDELTPSPEPKVLEPEPVKPAKPKPAVKPVKVDQIGTVTPTPEQLKEAVLEILGREPGFATTEMLRLNLNGAPWCFKVDPPVYDDSCSGDSELKDFLNQMEIAGDIQSFLSYGFGFYGKFWRLPSLSTPSEPEPVKADLIASLPIPSLNQRIEIVLKSPACIYCGTDMQAINGNPGQWRCLNSVMHSFYVSNGRGVWVDNSGTFDKQITEMPSWAKKES